MIFHFILLLKMAAVYLKMATAIINRTNKQTEDSTLHFMKCCKGEVYDSTKLKVLHVDYCFTITSCFTVCDMLQTSELLFSCRKLTSAEALSLGLVSQVLDSDNFHEHLLPIVTAMANQSSQVCSWVVKVNTEPNSQQINSEISPK